MGAAGSRAAPQMGTFQKITLGPTSKLVGAGKYSISGETRRTQETSEFNDDVDVFEFSGIDGGTISLTDVVYDPTDPEQTTLRNAVINKTKLTNSATTGFRMWLNNTNYFTVGTSGSLLMTSAGKIDTDRNGMARTAFEAKVSGALIYLA